MKKIAGYVKLYVLSVPAAVFLWSALFIGTAIFCNYYFGINRFISSLTFLPAFSCWYIIFATVFTFGYYLQFYFSGRYLRNPSFFFLLFLSPAIFAWKMSYKPHFRLVSDYLQNIYWNHILYWPFKLVVLLMVLLLLWKTFNREQPFYGTATKAFSVKPYLILLLLMVPLIAAAATQFDFLVIYPKLKNIQYLAHAHNWYYTLLYELSYGSDFLSIEFFFRGFLVLAFAKWAGKEAVLPMALFYCTIHFGKPLGECISSFFGGLALGAITYYTRTIWGGLIVHLGVAWLMELGGYLGNHFLLPSI